MERIETKFKQMEIVLTHNNMDFDALAAQYAVTRLYPQARMVLGYPITGNVRRFLSLYRGSLPIKQMRYLDYKSVSRLFLVDCQHFDRLDDVAQRLILERVDLSPVTIFDHHDPGPEGFAGVCHSESVIKMAGSATTLLVEKIAEKKITLTSFEATLLLTGIYEDSGCLTYAGTTPLDARCVAYLLEQGADLAHVNEFIRPKLSDVQTLLLEELVSKALVTTYGGVRTVVASAQREDFIDGLATLTRKLVEVVGADAAIVVVKMRDRIHVVGRSDSSRLDIRALIRELGGDGHPGAASAVVKHMEVVELHMKIHELLAKVTKPEILAREIMSSPVRTINPHVSMDEANRLMIRHAEDGMVVTDGEKIVGVIARRDLDQASHHKLGHAPVCGFMSHPVISITPETPLSQIQQLMVKEDIGRLPVLDKGDQIVGLVSRRDVLRTLYGVDERKATQFDVDQLDAAVAHGHDSVDNMQIADKLEKLDEPTRWLFERIGETAAKLNMVAYAVGGSVRDLLLDRPNFDLDFVIEGSAGELGKELERAYPGRLKVVAHHDRFQTATLEYFAERKREVDLSTARTEFYEFPAALPTVEPSRLEQDLLRRDFTINALAVCLNPGRYGILIDHFGGLDDLEKRLVRILHAFSFIEDPTRIVRAARFAARLGFDLESKTREQGRRTIAMGIFDDLGGVRMRAELKMILESPHRLKALALLAEMGGKLGYLDAELQFNGRIAKLMRRAERLLMRFPLAQPGDEWAVFLGVLLADLTESRLPAVLERLQLSNDQKTIVSEGLRLAKNLDADLSALRRSDIYTMMRGRPKGALAIAASVAGPGSAVRRIIKLYLDELEDISPPLNGEELLAMGFPEGPRIGNALNDLLVGALDGTLKNREDALKFILQAYPDDIASKSDRRA